MKFCTAWRALVTILFVLSAETSLSLQATCLDLSGEKNGVIDIQVKKVGDSFETPGGQNLMITKVVLDGHKGVVYKTEKADGTVVALKVAIENSPDVLDSFLREPQKEPLYDKLGVRYAKIYEFGKNYIIKEWVEGERGDAWAAKWMENGANVNKKKYKQLVGLFRNLKKQKAYVGNLKALNMIHDGKDWVIVDSGTPKFDQDPAYITEKYVYTMNKRWLGGLRTPNGKSFRLDPAELDKY